MSTKFIYRLVMGVFDVSISSGIPLHIINEYSVYDSSFGQPLKVLLRVYGGYVEVIGGNQTQRLALSDSSEITIYRAIRSLVRDLHLSLGFKEVAGACITLFQTSFLLLGGSKSGKTELLLTLLSKGYGTVVANDLLFVDQVKREVVGLPTSFGIRNLTKSKFFPGCMLPEQCTRNEIRYHARPRMIKERFDTHFVNSTPIRNAVYLTVSDQASIEHNLGGQHELFGSFDNEIHLKHSYDFSDCIEKMLALEKV